MKKLLTLVALSIAACSVIGCGSSDDAPGSAASADVKQLPATAPVSSEAQKAAQAEVDKDPKAEKPRADGG